MEVFFAVLSVILIAVVAALVWIALLVKGRSGAESGSIRHEINEVITNNMSLVNERLDRVTGQVTESLSKVTDQVNEQLRSVTTQLQSSTLDINKRMDNAARVVGEVREGLGSLSEATKQVFEVGKDISSLQEILRAPKLRGELGEFFLGDLLAQILPPANYELQYQFKDGTRVDAVVKFSGGLVPIDSKFPLENFRKFIDGATEDDKKKAKREFVKDVKKRIDEIADSYIVPDEGTFNFALMYVPAENVYYETIIKDSDFTDDKQIAAYAFSRRVIPVSPNSFYAYLNTILLGLRGMEISKEAEAILKYLDGLKTDFGKFSSDFETIGKHITNTKNKYDEAQKKAERFGEKLGGVGGATELESGGGAGAGDDDAQDSGDGEKKLVK